MNTLPSVALVPWGSGGCAQLGVRECGVFGVHDVCHGMFKVPHIIRILVSEYLIVVSLRSPTVKALESAFRCLSPSLVIIFSLSLPFIFSTDPKTLALLINKLP